MLTREDVDYITAAFVPLDDLARDRGFEPDDVLAAIRARRLPEPPYVLDDGTAMVPPDYFALAEEAGGVERLRDLFVARYAAAAAAEAAPLDSPDLEWESYLSGDYGVCLRKVTPETIVRKSALVAYLEGYLAEPRPEDLEWRDNLRAAVDELDALEREFAPDYDRSDVHDRPPTRDLLIDAARMRYPDVFADDVAGEPATAARR